MVPFVEMTWRSSGLCSSAAILLIAGLHLGCNSNVELPAPAPKPLPYSTRKIAIPGCSVEIPPVQDDSKSCPLDAIGKSIRTEDVCLLVTALKDWMANVPLDHMGPDDWSRIRAITVCRDNTPTQASRPKTQNYQLTVSADGPELQRPFWVTMQEDDRKMSFGRTHRGGG